MKKSFISKLIAGGLIAAMSASLVIGCGEKKETPDDGKTPVEDEAKKDSKEDAKSGAEEQVLKVAAGESAYGADIWKEVCKAFEDMHEGVKVELTIDKKLEDKIMPNMKAGVYPDVIMRAVGGEMAMTETFVKDNNVVDLSDVMDMTVPGEDKKVSDKMIPGFTENSISKPYDDGKIYLMPMFYAPCGLWYNAALLEEKGWKIPETWDEMWELGEKAKAEDIALFTYPTAGYFDAFFYALLHSNTTDEQFHSALTYADGIWDTPEVKQVFDIIEKLAGYTHPLTPGQANNDGYLKNQQLILDNKAIFMPNGTWVVGEMKDAPRADGFKWGFTYLPAVKAGGEKASYTFFEQIWMPKGAEHQDLGKEFIAFVYSDKAAEIFAKTGAIQPIKGMSDKLEGDQKMFYSIYDTGAVAVMDAFATTDPVEGVTARSTFFEPIDSLVTGDKTKDEWLEQIKEDSDKLRAALK